MNYRTLFKISSKEYELFIKKFSNSIPSKLKRKFNAENIHLFKNGCSLETHYWTDTSEKPARRVETKVLMAFDEEKIRAFYFWAENKDTYRVWEGPPSKLSSNLYSGNPVFEIGIPVVDEEAKTETVFLISGEEREQLKSEKQKEKWDYFFRAFHPRIGLKQKRKIVAKQKIIKKLEKELFARRIYLILFGVLILLSILYLSFSPTEILLVFIGLAAAVLGGIFQWNKVHSLQKDKKTETKWILGLKQEIDNLKRQVKKPSDIPSEEKVEEWLVEELGILEEDSMKELDIDPKQLPELDKKLRKRVNLKSICIEELGISQPKEVNGRNVVNGNHMEAIRIKRDGLPHFGVYYIQFIFLTDDKIAVCGFFYDFILSLRQGTITDEFYYGDVVSVQTKRVSFPSPFDQNRHIELEMFRLGVPNSETIQVALSDEALFHDMNDRIEAKKKLKEEGYENGYLEEEDQKLLKELGLVDDESSKVFNWEKNAHLVEIGDSQLPKTTARAAISRIRKELSSRKVQPK